MPHYSANEICHKRDYEKKKQNKQNKKINGKETQYVNVKASSKQRKNSFR